MDKTSWTFCNSLKKLNSKSKFPLYNDLLLNRSRNENYLKKSILCHGYIIEWINDIL